MKKYITALSLCLLCANICLAQRQVRDTKDSVRLDARKPSMYLEFVWYSLQKALGVDEATK